MKGYLGFNLTENSRAEIFARFSPKFPIILGNHVTYKYDVADDEFIPNHTRVKVIGYASNQQVECLVVLVDDETHAPDGRRYHITLSHVPEVKPFSSNKLLTELGFEACDSFSLEVEPTFNPFPR